MMQITRFCIVLGLLALSSFASRAQVPSGAPSAVVLDGRLSKGEWAGAAEHALAGGGRLLIRQAAKYVHVAVEGTGFGWSHVYVAHRDTVRVFHASAALGTARYVQEAGRWRLAQPFVWAMRDTTRSAAAQAERAAFLEHHGWVANTNGMGSRRVNELRIAKAMFDAGAPRLAVLFAEDPAEPRHWPDTLADATLDADLVRGAPPEHLVFEPESWAQITLDPRPDVAEPGREPKIRFRPFPDLGDADRGGTSRGVAWGDFTGDGYPDLVVSNTDGEGIFLYRNVGGRRLASVTDTPITSLTGHAQGVNWIDVDNDGALDLFVAREEGPNLLLRNDGEGTLRRADAGALTEDVSQSVQGCWADYDNDGFLDVFVVNADSEPDVLYRNVDGTHFTPVQGPWQGLDNHGRSCAWSDADADGHPDLYVANAYMRVGEATRTAPNYFYSNREGVSFARITDGEFVNYHAYSYGVSFADFDQDGDEDLFVSAIGRFDPNVLFENVDGSLFHPVRNSMLMRDRFGPVKGHAWGDYDNDGDVDLFVAEGHGGARPEHAPFDNTDRLYENTGDGDFEVASVPLLADHDLVSAGTANADFDRDGDLDLFIANWGSASDDDSARQDNQFFENVSQAGNWITVRLSGTRSNRMGIGSHVSITAGEGENATTQYRTLASNVGYGSMNEPVIHFGIGAHEAVRELKIRWPSGAVDTHLALPAGARYVVTESGEITPER